MDLFVVPTISFKLLYGLLILRHDRRRILWIGVTSSPTAEWVARQVSEACGWEPVPDYLVRDRDRVYGEAFMRRIRAMGIRDRPTAPRSPWQNGYSERLIGSIRRECLDHVIIICERHLRHILRSYQQYYNDTRTHLSLAKDSPDEIRPGGRSHSSAAGPPADCTIMTSGSDFRQGQPALLQYDQAILPALVDLAKDVIPRR
jgi:transposase InsO family protein